MMCLCQFGESCQDIQTRQNPAVRLHLAYILLDFAHQFCIQSRFYLVNTLLGPQNLLLVLLQLLRDIPLGIRDSCPFDFPLLDAGKDVLAVQCQIPQRVQFPVYSGCDDSPFSYGSGRVRIHRPGQCLQKPGTVRQCSHHLVQCLYSFP